MIGKVHAFLAETIRPTSSGTVTVTIAAASGWPIFVQELIDLVVETDTVFRNAGAISQNVVILASDTFVFPGSEASGTRLITHRVGGVAVTVLENQRVITAQTIILIASVTGVAVLIAGLAGAV